MIARCEPSFRVHAPLAFRREPSAADRRCNDPRIFMRYLNRSAVDELAGILSGVNRGKA